MKKALLLIALLATGCVTSEGVVDAERSSRVNTQLGVAYLHQNQLELAMGKLTKALEQDPDYPDAHGAIALLYERIGEHGKAEVHFKRALELAPADSSVANNYGRFLCARDRVADAEPLFLRAASNPLHRAPELPLTNAALCALKGDRKAQAEDYLLRALKANPRFAPALLKMAELRLEAGQAESAKGYYDRYLSLAPQNPESLLLGIRLGRVLGDQDAVASYSLVLKGKFPDSEETRRLLELERNER